MKITLLTVGKIKEKYFTMAIDEYAKRLSRYVKLDIVEVADEKTPDGASETEERMIRDKEGKRIASVMALEAPAEWGTTFSREFFLGHFHSRRTEVDENGVMLSIAEVRERLRNDQPLQLNEDANWNNRQKTNKEYYLKLLFGDNEFIGIVTKHP